MPDKVHECVKSVLADNPEMPEERAWAICHSEIDAEAMEIATLSELNLEADAIDELAAESDEWTAVDGGWINTEEQLAVYDPDALETEGQTLGSRLRELIDEQTDDDTTRDDVVDDIMAESGGMDRSTINAIIEGDIECPPPQRFRAFAQVLDTTMDELLNAAEEDGCEYESLEEEGQFDPDALDFLQGDGFAVDVFRIVQAEDSDMDLDGDLMGVGVDFPNAGVYVDWRIDAWPDDEQLEEPHVSDYGTIEDLEQATGGVVEHIETVDVATEGDGTETVEEEAVTVRGLSKQAIADIEDRYNVDVEAVADGEATATSSGSH